MSPWRGPVGTVCVAVAAAGAAMIAAAAYGAADERVVADQAPWIALGVTGVILAAASSAAVIVAARAALRLRAAGLVNVLALAEHASDAPDRESLDLVSLAGATRYHRPGCSLIVGKAAVAAAPGAHERDGRRPCGVCLP